MFSLLLLVASCERTSSAATGGVPPLVDGPDQKPPVDLAATAEVPVRMPSDQVVTRQCFASSHEEQARRNYPPPPPPASPVSSRSAAPKAAAPAPTMAQPMGGTAGLGDGSSYGGSPSSNLGASGTKATTTTPSAKPADVAASAPAMPVAEPSPVAAPSREDVTADRAQAGESQTYRAKDKKEAEKSNRDENMDAPNNMAGPATASTEAGRMAGADESSRWDLGATTYLSNDDSMSHASAHRLLFAIQHKAPVSSSQIRPHEFLNYFSFDTRPVANGDTFSVLAAAEQTGPDTLSLSMAVKGAIPARQPLDLTLVLDRSGSMSAEGRMEYLRRGLQKMTKENLKRGDRIDMVLFDNELCVPLENYVVGRDDPAILDNVISQLQPRGSTDLDLGLREGYRIARNHVDTSNRNRRIMLITDALLNTGDVNPDTVSEIGKAFDESGIRLTGVGVGLDFNDKVLDKLTEKGKGAYVYLGSEAVVDRIFGVGFDSLTRTIATNVRFALDLPDSLAMERFYGEEASTNPEDIQTINYYSGTTQLFLQDLHLRSTGPVRGDVLKLTISYEDPQTGAKKSQEFNASVGDLLASDPRNLHKGRALMAWTDMLSTKAMGGSPCGQPFQAWKERVSALGEDTEIGWLDGLTRPLCGESAPVLPPARPSGVAYKVKVDSDMPIAEVNLSCNGQNSSDSLSGSDTVATFTATPGASCILTLQGNVPMQTTVQVPVTGGDLRCMVRGGRLSCS